MAKKHKFTNLTPDEELYVKAADSYAAGKPIMTDADFDLLEAKLIAEDSFVVDIIGTTGNGLKLNTPHSEPMLSLQKIKFKKDYTPATEFNNFFSCLSDSQEFEFGPKLDGNAINLEYVNGALVSVASRGDGSVGQNYTAQLSGKLPRFIKDFTGAIRGEAVVDVNVFISKYKKDGTDPNKIYTNARNFVAGTLNRDYSKQDQSKYDDIDFVAFDVKGIQVPNKNQWLASKGFDIVDKTVTTTYGQSKTQAGLKAIFDAFTKYRINSKYQLDGFVCKITDPNKCVELGNGKKYPNWALAIKFVAEEVSTKVKSIEYSLTKRGELSPVAILEPVELMDSTVQRASVYNAKWMMEKKCLPGAEVVIVKSGDIIPKIVEIQKESDIAFVLPTEWNGHKVSFNGTHLVLDDFENTEEFKAIQMYHTISSLGFKNIGPALCERLSNASITIQDIMKQNPQGLRSLLLRSGAFVDGRELEVLIENFFALNEVDLADVIRSFGWRNCGRTISGQLANYMTGVPHSFAGLEESVVEAFTNSQERKDQVKELVGLLLDNNITVRKPVSTAGLITFEMTGEPTTHETKGHFKTEVQKTGKAKHTSLGKDTTYLVTNSPGSTTGKMQKAIKYGVKIVTYEQFLDIVK